MATVPRVVAQLEAVNKAGVRSADMFVSEKKSLHVTRNVQCSVK